MNEHGLDDALRQLVQDGRKWVAVGTVDAIESHPAWGHLVTVTERPKGRQLQARVLWLGTGPGEGAYVPLRVGDEVLLVFPEGRGHRAIAVPGLTGGDRVPPTSFDNAHIDLVHSGGVEVRSDEAAAVEKVLRAVTFQADLNDYLATLDQFMLTTSTAVFGWQISAAATVFKADPRVTTFKARVASGFYSAVALKSE